MYTKNRTKRLYNKICRWECQNIEKRRRGKISKDILSFGDKFTSSAMWVCMKYLKEKSFKFESLYWIIDFLKFA